MLSLTIRITQHVPKRYVGFVLSPYVIRVISGRI